MTLGEILKNPWGYEFRARATELRKEGYSIVCTKGKRPSENVYTLSDPAFTVHVDKSGQREMIYQGERF